MQYYRWHQSEPCKQSEGSRGRLVDGPTTVGRSPAAAAGSAVAANDATGPDADIGSSGSTACDTPEATLADTIATAVLRQLEQSGRLLPARPTMPSTSAVADVVAEAELLNHADASSVDSAEVDADAALSGILGGDIYSTT